MCSNIRNYCFLSSEPSLSRPVPIPSAFNPNNKTIRQKKKVSITISQSVVYSRFVMEAGVWVLHKRKNNLWGFSIGIQTI